jgi:hypothetical protein
MPSLYAQFGPNSTNVENTIALKIPIPAILSVMGIFQQLKKSLFQEHERIAHLFQSVVDLIPI